MYKRLLPVGTALVLLFGFALWFQSNDTDTRIFVGPSTLVEAENPKEISRIDSKNTPKNENPGERFLHDYMLTKDPATGTVPIDRLLEATQFVIDQKNSPIKAASMSWTERGPDDVGGRTRAIMFDPNDGANEKVWAGGVSGGLWYTNDITDPSEVWNSVDDFWSNLAVTAMAYDPTNTQVFYAGTGEGFFNIDAVLGGGVFKSTDGGTTWAQLPSTTPSTSTGVWNGVQDLVVTSAGTVLAATREALGVQRSTDGGTTWSSVLALAEAGTSRAADLEIDANGNIWAAMGIFTESGVWLSTDDGVTWTQMNSGANGFPSSGFERVEIATAPSDANVVYALTQDPSGAIQAIYRSGDAGATWVSMPLPADCDLATIGAADFTRSQAWYDLIAAVSPNDPNDLVVGGIDLFRSSNGSADSGGGAGSGATWTQISIWLSPAALGCTNSPAPPVVHADQHAIVYRPGTNNEVVFGHDGGVDYTADVTANLPTFVNRNNDYNVTQFYAGSMQSLSGNNLLVGGTQDNGTPQLSSAGVGTSFGDATGGDGGFTHINQATNVLAMGANTGSNLHRSLDGGTTWAVLGSLGAGCPASFINPSDLHDGTNELFLNCTSAAIGHVWDLLTGSPLFRIFGPGGGFGGTPTHIRTSPFGAPTSATVYIGTSGAGIHRGADLQDGGTPAWSVISTTGFPAGSISSIDFGAGEDTILVTLSNYGVASVWETFDGGSTWNDRDTGSNLPDVPVRWGMYDPNDRNKVMLATEVGVMETDDITAVPVVWAAAPSFPTVRTDMLKYRAADGTILAATHGRGMWTGVVTTLPVELVDFASIMDGDDVTLVWNTASETANAGFEVEHARPAANERSADALSFNAVGFVDGSGTTTDPQSYSFTMEDLLPGSHSFRLKQIDLNGAYSYSDVVEIDVNVQGQVRLAPAYPNPFSDEATITLHVAATQDVEVELFDMAGRKVTTLFRGTLQANEGQQVTINGANLASGQYVYRVNGESFTETRVVTVVK